MLGPPVGATHASPSRMHHPARPPKGRQPHRNSKRIGKRMEEKPRTLRGKCGFVHEIPERPVRNRPQMAIPAHENGRNRPKTLKTCRKPSFSGRFCAALLG